MLLEKIGRIICCRQLKCKDKTRRREKVNQRKFHTNRGSDIGENIPTRELQFLVCLFTIWRAGTSTQA